MADKKLIIEIGCGICPWPVKRQLATDSPEKYSQHRSEIMDEYANLESDDRFVFSDINIELIRSVREFLIKCGLMKKYTGFANRILANLFVADGGKLPFVGGIADVVIVSDVLSAPEPGTAPVSEPYPDDVCISSAAKKMIVRSAVRLLKDEGTLVIAVSQTPCYAKSELAWFQKEYLEPGIMRLTKQCGKFVNSDNWHLYHAAFKKKCADDSSGAVIIPWTKAQKDFIERYAASWITC